MSSDTIVDGTLDQGEMTAAERHTAEASADYGADSVKHLKDADHIRLRPGMYIGESWTKSTLCLADYLRSTPAAYPA